MTGNVVTFGDWSPNVDAPRPRSVVAYGPSGEPLWFRSYGELFSVAEAAKHLQPWGGPHYLDEGAGNIVLLIAKPFANPLDVRREYDETRLRLSDGVPQE